MRESSTRKELVFWPIILLILFCEMFVLSSCRKNPTPRDVIGILNENYTGKVYYLVYAPGKDIYNDTPEHYVKFIDREHVDVHLPGMLIHGSYGEYEGQQVIWEDSIVYDDLDKEQSHQERLKERAKLGLARRLLTYHCDINNERVILWDKNLHSRENNPFFFEESSLFNAHSVPKSDPATKQTGFLGRWDEGVTCYEFYDNWTGVRFSSQLDPKTDQYAMPFTWYIDGDVLNISYCKYEIPDQYHFHFSQTQFAYRMTWSNLKYEPYSEINFSMIDPETNMAIKPSPNP